MNDFIIYKLQVWKGLETRDHIGDETRDDLYETETFANETETCDLKF